MTNETFKSADARRWIAIGKAPLDGMQVRMTGMNKRGKGDNLHFYTGNSHKGVCAFSKQMAEIAEITCRNTLSDMICGSQDMADQPIRSSTLSPSNALATLLLARNVRPYFRMSSGASCSAVATQATSVEAFA